MKNIFLPTWSFVNTNEFALNEGNSLVKYHVPKFPWSASVKYRMYSADGRTYTAITNNILYIGYDGQLRNAPTIYKMTKVSKKVLKHLYYHADENDSKRFNVIDLYDINPVVIASFTINRSTVRALRACRRFEKWDRTTNSARNTPNSQISLQINMYPDGTAYLNWTSVRSAQSASFGGITSMVTPCSNAKTNSPLNITLTADTLKTFIDLASRLGAGTQLRISKNSSDQLAFSWCSPSWEGTVYSLGPSL